MLELRWVYAADGHAFRLFKELFDACDIAQHFAANEPLGRNLKGEITLYAGSFVVRSSQGLVKPMFHEGAPLLPGARSCVH